MFKNEIIEKRQQTKQSIINITSYLMLVLHQNWIPFLAFKLYLPYTIVGNKCFNFEYEQMSATQQT